MDYPAPQSPSLKLPKRFRCRLFRRFLGRLFWRRTFFDEEFELDESGSLKILARNDIIGVDGTANDLDEDVSSRVAEFHENQRAQVVLLPHEGIMPEIDAVLGEVVDLPDIVLVGGVEAIALDLQVRIRLVGQLRNKPDDSVDLDGDARLAGGKSKGLVHAFIDHFRHFAQIEGARLGRRRVGFRRIGGAIAEQLWILAIEITDALSHAGDSAGSGKEIVEILNVSFVRFVVGGIEFDERVGLVGLRAESHGRMLREDGVTPDQTGHFVIGESVQEDREHPGKEGGEAGIVDEVKEANLSPRRRRPSEDGAGLTVVDER